MSDDEDDAIDLLGGSHDEESNPAADAADDGSEGDAPESNVVGPDADAPDPTASSVDISDSPETLDTGDVPDDDGSDGSDSRDRVDGPLGSLADRLDREDREQLDADEDVFEEVDTGDVNVEDVWEQLEAGPGPQGERLEESDDVRRISQSVCHECPHFGEPPELHCTHEGTVIREMPDSEHFVVVECPVVAGEEDI